MAKQVGDIIIVGTIDDITFYIMEGKGYARKKSRLTGKRVKKDPKFKRTMQSAQRLGRGSQMASKVYRSLPRAEQVYALYKELKSMAIRTLKEGKSEAEVMELLLRRVAGLLAPPPTAAPPGIQKRHVAQKRSPCIKKLFGPASRKRNKELRKGKKLQILVQRE
jgi:hypothetical protein